ncbi:hypothetical protein ACP70R_037711 [Stipagrostis hirtigluma subsp. patula]
MGHEFTVVGMTWLLAAAAALVLLQLSAADDVAGDQIALPSCPTSCGDVSVPYPFGFSPGCYLPGFDLVCDDTSRRAPPRLLLGDGTLEVESVSISTGDLRARSTTLNAGPFGLSSSPVWLLGLGNPYTIAGERNELILTGCDVFGSLASNGWLHHRTLTGCASVCGNLASIILEDSFSANVTLANGKKCFGVGCCQAQIPAGTSIHDMEFMRLRVDDARQLDAVVPVSMLIAENGWFDRDITSLEMFRSQLANMSVPLILNWAINSIALAPNETRAGSATCPKDLGTTIACHSQFSVCKTITYDHYTNYTAGYICQCLPGYRGNPYLPQGCQDIDECTIPGRCYGTCTNVPASYICECPSGTHGDPQVPNGCIRVHNNAALSIGVGVGSGAMLIFLVVGTMFLVHKVKAQRQKKLKQMFFNQNRGQLLQQLVCQRTDIAERMIVTLEELQKATNNFDKSRELGCGGHGTVYKGILSSLHVVAIKKSKIVIQREIDDFINEVAILSQINHKHIVRILGCCLETEVPLLVYEFVSNGSLYNHLHIESPISLPWKDRMRIAVETARATAYLHSFVSTPIIHRDIKSPNILLDDNLTVKLSDFGASRYVPIDQSGVDTSVQGTYGYLDPMYYSTGHLTEKSDVYSFGVLLIELLTRKKPVSYRSPEGYGLVKHFVTLLSQDNLDQILDPQVLKEGAGEVVDVSLLAAMCVKYVGQERPTMRQVEMALEAIHAAKEYVSSDVTDDDDDYDYEENSIQSNNDQSGGRIHADAAS